MSMPQPNELKQIVNEVIGPVASSILMGRVCELLENNHKDPVAQKQACDKIGKMVSLFIGPDTAQVLEKRFREKLN